MSIADDIKPPSRHSENTIHIKPTVDAESTSNDEPQNHETEKIKVKEVKEKSDEIVIEGRDIEPREAREFASANIKDDFFEQPIARNADKRKKKEDGDIIEKTSWLGIILFILLIFVALAAILYFSIPELKTLVNDKISLPFASSSSSVSVPKTSYSSISSSSATVSSESSSSSSTAAQITEMTIKVLNGSGITGAATTTKTALETAGYTVSYVGNANSYNYSSSYIYYKAGAKAKAEEIKTVLNNLTITISENDSVAGTYDVVVVVGKK